MRFRIVIRGPGDWPKELFWLFVRAFIVFAVLFSVVNGARGCAKRRWNENGRIINEEGSARTTAHSILI